MKATKEFLVTVTAIVRVYDESQLSSIALCLIDEDTYGSDTVITNNVSNDDYHFEVVEYTEDVIYKELEDED